MKVVWGAMRQQEKVSTGLQLGKGVLKMLIASTCPKLLDLALKINYCCSSSLW